MERCHSYSGGSWSLQNKEKSLQVATVKPVSKSVSEDNLHSDFDKKLVLQRVFSRLKINDLSVLKKDSLIGELEKCLEELETEHSQTLQLSNVYDQMETERDQLLNELDMAFQDLQEYMHRQKLCEDDMRAIEADRDELVKENEYLKAVLSNREEVQASKLYDENKKLNEEVILLLKRINDMTEEMDSLYEERQALISSLLSLQSEQVDGVIKSRTSLLGSSNSNDEHKKCGVESFDKCNVDSIMSINEITEVKKVLIEVLAENKEMEASVQNMINQLGNSEKEKKQIEAEYTKMKNEHDNKCKEYDKSLQEKNDKNLSLSKVNKEKRTLQMQVSALRERNRSSEAKILSLEDEFKKISDQLKESNNSSADLLKKNCGELQIKNQDISRELISVIAERDKLLKTIRKMEEDSEVVEKRYYNRVNSLEIDFNKLRNSKVRRKEDESLESKKHICECKISSKCKCVFLKNKKTNENLKPSEISGLNLCNLERVPSFDLSRDDSCNLNSVISIENNNTGTLMNTQTKTKMTLETEKLIEENNVLKDKCTEVNLEVTILKDTIQSYCLDLKNRKEKLDTLQETCDALLLEKSAVADSLRKIFQSNGEYISNDSLIHQINVLNELINQLNAKNQNLSSSYKSLSVQFVDLKEQYDKSGNLKDFSNEIEMRNQLACIIKERDEALCESHLYSEKCVIFENKIKQLNEENFNLLNQCKIFLSKIETLNSDLINLKENNNLLQLSSDKNQQIKENYISLHTQHEKLTELYNNLLEQHSLTALKLDQAIQENLTVKETYIDNLNSVQTKKDELMEHFVFNELQVKNLNLEIAELRAITESIENGYQSQISDYSLQMDQERKSFQTKYDTIRVECDKLKREKEHYLKTVDTLREENCDINNELKKLRVNLNEDYFYQCIQEDKIKMEELHSVIRQLTGEKAGLMDKIRSNEEISLANIRNLKAHKNELQHLVTSLEHENESLQRNCFSREDSKQIIELEEEKAEYLQKLKESEVLLLDLQKALAQANDVAMQKSLEGTKIRRCFEKKIDKLMHVNADLKKRSFLLSENNSSFLEKESKTLTEFVDEACVTKCDEDDHHQADLFCTVCLTNLCNFCAKETHKSRTLLLHKKIPISEKPRINPPCSLHCAHNLEFACLEELCRESPLMCYICKDYGIHKGHKHVLIEDEAENIRKSIQNALQHVKAFSAEVTAFSRKLAEISEKIEGGVSISCSNNGAVVQIPVIGNAEIARLRIREYFNELRDTIRQQENEALSVVNSYVRENLCSIRQQQEDMAVLISQISHVCSQCDQALLRSDAEVIQARANIVNLLDAVQKQQQYFTELSELCKEDPEIPFAFTKDNRVHIGPKMEMRVLALGLDNGGKTSILFKLKQNEFVSAITTIGFNVETIEHKSVKFTIWDVGGVQKLRPLWRHYYLNTQAVIFVIDSTNLERLFEAQEELTKLLAEKRLQDALILIYANKQDLPSALNLDDLREKIGIHRLCSGRTWTLIGCSAHTGTGLNEGLDWMARQFLSEFDNLS